LLIDHLADELPEKQAVLLEQHLASCKACGDEARVLQRIAVRPQEGGDPQRAVPERESRLLVETVIRSARERRFDRRIERRGARGFPSEGDPEAPRVLRWIVSLRRPLPSYAVLMLVLAAAWGGMLVGRTTQRPPMNAQPAEIRTTPASEPAAAEPTSAAPSGLAESLARRQSGGFVAVASDATGIDFAIPADSL
jgi:hypothetical protein